MTIAEATASHMRPLCRAAQALGFVWEFMTNVPATPEPLEAAVRLRFNGSSAMSPWYVTVEQARQALDTVAREMRGKGKS